MLSVKESSLLLGFMGLCSKLYFFPFTVDQKRGKINQFSEKNHRVWTLLYSVVITHYLNGLCQLLLLLALRQDRVVLYHLPAQFDAIIIPFMLHPVFIATYQFERDLLVKVFNELYDENSLKDQGRRPPWKLSIQELLAVGAGLIEFEVVVLYIGIIVVMPDMAHLMINNPVLEVLKSSAIAVTGATLLEMWTVVMWVPSLAFFLSLNCLVQSKMESMFISMRAALR